MRVQGVDVWDAYQVNDANAACQSGIEFAWLACSNGNGAIGSKNFDSNLTKFRAEGIVCGAYVVPHSSWTQDPVKFAEELYTRSKGLGTSPGELPPAIDCELPTLRTPAAYATMRKDAARIVNAICRMVDAFEARWERPPVIYTYPDWWNTLGSAASLASELSRCPLWAATIYYPPGKKEELPYFPADTQKPKILKPWSDWSVWQYSATHSTPVPGIRGVGCQKRHPGCDGIDRNLMEYETFCKLAMLDP